jgi:hypothetical protein
MFSKERDRLLKFDSLTVLDYIKTSIEILMQMKLDEDKVSTSDKNHKSKNLNANDPQNQTPLSSTIKSLDLVPKEYE